MNIKKLCFCFLFVGCGGMVAIVLSQEQQPSGRQLKTQWDRSVREGASASAFMEFHSAEAHDGKFIWVSAQEIFKSGEQMQSKRWLWKLDQNGQTLFESELNALSDLAESGMESMRGVDSLACSDNGELALFGTNNKGNSFMMLLNDSGAVLRSRELSNDSSNLIIKDAVFLSDGTLMLAGVKKNFAYLARISSEGSLVWEKTVDHSQPHQWFSEILLSPDGDVYVLGQFGRFTQFNAGPFEIWIGKYNSNGSLQKEYSTVGSQGSMTLDKGGRLAIVYDQNPDESIELCAALLTVGLEKISTSVLSKSPNGFAQFRIRSLPEGGYIAAGTDQRIYPVVYELNESGQVVCEYQDTAKTMTGDLYPWVTNKSKVVVVGRGAYKSSLTSPKASIRIAQLNLQSDGG